MKEIDATTSWNWISEPHMPLHVTGATLNLFDILRESCEWTVLVDRGDNICKYNGVWAPNILSTYARGRRNSSLGLVRQ